MICWKVLWTSLIWDKFFQALSVMWLISTRVIKCLNKTWQYFGISETEGAHFWNYQLLEVSKYLKGLFMMYVNAFFNIRFCQSAIIFTNIAQVPHDSDMIEQVYGPKHRPLWLTQFNINISTTLKHDWKTIIIKAMT